VKSGATSPVFNVAIKESFPAKTEWIILTSKKVSVFSVQEVDNNPGPFLKPEH
jgi:hypothetical protein